MREKKYPINQLTRINMTAAPKTWQSEEEEENTKDDDGEDKSQNTNTDRLRFLDIG